MRVYQKFLIDGRWVDPDGKGTFDVHDAATEGSCSGAMPATARSWSISRSPARARPFFPWAMCAA